MRLERTARDDPGLERRVAFDECGVGEERIPERDVALELLLFGQHVTVDAERRTGTDDRPDEHRAAWRPWVGPRLRSEAELAEHRGDRRHVVRGRRDREVDDPLARQTRHRGTADVLDDEIGSTLIDQLGDGLGDLERPGVPWLDGGRPSLIRADRGKHRGSVDCRPMRHVIGRRTLEVDVG